MLLVGGLGVGGGADTFKSLINQNASDKRLISHDKSVSCGLTTEASVYKKSQSQKVTSPVSR